MHCDNEQEFVIINVGTGKEWRMCEWHRTQYTRDDKVMVNRGRIKETN
jgi:hypothetical protein